MKQVIEENDPSISSWIRREIAKRKSRIERSDLKVRRPDNCSQSEPEKEENLFLCFCSYSVTNYVFCYSIDPTNNTSGKIINLSPICTLTDSDIGRGSGTIALGLKIYMIGGDRSGKLEGSTDILCFDTQSQPPFQWRKEKFHILAKRCQPAVVAAHGKIFVFGSNICRSKPKPWAEVFDPKLNLCTPLPEPPSEVIEAYGSIDVAVVANGDKILLCMEDSLFSFDVRNKLWVRVSSSLFNPSRWSYRSTTIDDVLFMYCEGRVLAYDLVGEKWFDKPVKGLGIASRSAVPRSELRHGYVVHIGNKTLCVVWYDEVKSRTCVRCLKFRVVRINRNSKGGGSYLRAEVQCGSAYRIVSGNFFSDCLAV